MLSLYQEASSSLTLWISFPALLMAVVSAALSLGSGILATASLTCSMLTAPPSPAAACCSTSTSSKAVANFAEGMYEGRFFPPA